MLQDACLGFETAGGDTAFDVESEGVAEGADGGLGGVVGPRCGWAFGVLHYCVKHFEGSGVDSDII